LPQGVVGLLVAPGGTGKTAVLAQMAACVATGVPWLGCFEVHKTGPVLLVMGEEGPPEMDRRLSNIAKSFGIAYGSNGCRALTQDNKRTTEGVPKPNDVRERFAKNIHALPLMGHRCPLIEPAPGGSYTTTGYLKAICEMVNRQAKDGEPYRAVIMDPAARFMGLEDENDNMGATHFIQALEDITKCAGNPTVLVAHHANKSAATGKANQAAARGASALVDNARWMAQMQAVDVPAGEDYRTAAELSLQKSNYGAKPPAMLVVRDGMGWFAPTPEDQARISERARIEAWEREGLMKHQKAHHVDKFKGWTPENDGHQAGDTTTETPDNYDPKQHPASEFI
jgi:RecA-family ATPase